MKKFLCIIFILIGPSHVFASTSVGTTLINQPTTWTKLKGPYVIEGRINISTSGSLTVEAGAKLMFKNGYIFSQGGKVSVTGTPDKEIEIEILQNSSSPILQGSKAEMRFSHVSIHGLSRPFLNIWDRSKVYMDGISHAAVSNTSSRWITVFGSSTIDMNHVLLSGWKGVGIEVFENAVLTLKNSDLQNIGTGVYIFANASSTMTGNVFSANSTAIYANTPNLSLTQNDFENNRVHINNIGARIQAPDNWWGSILTPKTYGFTYDIPATEVGALVGDVQYSPISSEKHRKGGLCCSNVLFFPGLMGSRLYVKSLGLENQLWEPNRNADVKKLFLNAAGESLLSGVYTKDIINRTNIAFGTPFIDQSPYKGFSAFMDKLVKDKFISAWQSMPYDWRFAPDTLLEMSNTELENVIVSLSQKSKTKKVTLLSHSNGGLVVKQLMIRLKEVQLDHLIDKIIFVALPEYGTPQAITSLLFGHEQSIAAGLILKSSVAKDLGKNMPTAYTLLPSDAFFTRDAIRFLSQDITTGSTLRTVLSNYEGVNTSLLQKASNLHNTLDAWISPVPVFQILGTGLPTVTGLQKIDGDDFIPTYTSVGDGMVPDMFDAVTHTFSRTGTSVVVDLTKEKEIKHMSIMNSTGIQKQISSVIREGVLGAGDVDSILRLPLSYKVVKVSASSSDNLLLKDQYDTYKSSPLSSFDFTNESSNKNRYELFDGSVLYLNLDSLEKFAISQQSNGVSVSSIDVDLFEREGEILNQSHFADVPINPAFAVSVNGAVLAVKINRDLTLNIYPDRDLSLDASGNIISQTIATSTRDRTREAAQVRSQMIRGIVSDTLRKRYLTRLDAFAATGDLTYLQGTRARIQRALASITRFDSNPSLKARYAALKLDYQLLAYLFYYMSPDRPLQMQFVSS